MASFIKIVLSILFFLCLADMPYGFYELVRFTALGGFVILAVQADKEGNKKMMIIYAALALLFQPFFKISLGRDLWNIIDVTLGIALIVSIFLTKTKENAKFPMD